MRASFRTRAIGGAITIALTLLLSAAAEARVVRFVVEQTRSFAGGMAFGTTGAYERLDGTAYMEVDPHDPLNAVIVNLSKAPRNARGMVEFSSPFFILKPVDMGRGNHKIFYAINNRGNKNSIGRFDFAVESNDPLTAADAGDGFLLRLGYTIVDAGWPGGGGPGGERPLPQLPGGHAAGREPDRRRRPYRVLGPHDPPGRDLHPYPGRQSQLPLLRDGRQQHGPLDAHRTQRGRGCQGADRVGPLGLRDVPDRAGEPRPQSEQHLSV